MKKTYFTYIALLALLVSSCREEPSLIVEPVPGAPRLLIANEGPFVDGSGTISSFSPRTGEIEANLFQKANVYLAGGVLRSIYTDDDFTFIVVGDKGLLYVVDTETLRVLQVYNNLLSPRYVMKAAVQGKYYISDWELDGVHVLNTTTQTIEKTILTGSNPERMLLNDGKLFVANSGGTENFADSTVIVIDAMLDEIIDTLHVGANPNSMQVDKNNILWILSSGIPDNNNVVLSTPGKLTSFYLDSVFIDTVMNKLDTIITFTDQTVKPADLQVSKDGEQLYYINHRYNGDIMRFDVELQAHNTNPFINGNFYGFIYDNKDDVIYVAQSSGQTDNGKITRFSRSGTSELSFSTGVIPGSFTFRD